MRRICVFCGSNKGLEQSYVDATKQLGRAFADQGIKLVYGGGHVGLMGVVADSVIDAGGKAIGVIPQALVDRELAHGRLTELHVVNSMHERKALMSELSDAFIALPGGFGTLEEFAEILTWSLLGFQKKPSGLLNVDGYYDSLIEFFDNAVQKGFISKTHRSLVLVSKDPLDMLQQIKSFRHPGEEKWLTKSEL
jgi:uncharacterized protein (TIGR00730 family)